MATTMYFEEVVADEGKSHKPIKLEFGTMTALANGGNLYLRVDDGDAVLVPLETAKRMLEQLESAITWLGGR